jgi:hypothetical protein
MASKKNQINLLQNLHRSYSEALSKDHSAETKEKIKNLLQIIEVVLKSLKRQDHEAKIKKTIQRTKKDID